MGSRTARSSGGRPSPAVRVLCCAETGGGGLRAIDYVLGATLVAIVVLALASMIGVPLGPLDPALLMTRALDALTPA